MSPVRPWPRLSGRQQQDPYLEAARSAFDEPPVQEQDPYLSAAQEVIGEPTPTAVLPQRERVSPAEEYWRQTMAPPPPARKPTVAPTSLPVAAVAQLIHGLTPSGAMKDVPEPVEVISQELREKVVVPARRRAPSRPFEPGPEEPPLPPIRGQDVLAVAEAAGTAAKEYAYLRALAPAARAAGAVVRGLSAAERAALPKVTRALDELAGRSTIASRAAGAVSTAARGAAEAVGFGVGREALEGTPPGEIPEALPGYAVAGGALGALLGGITARSISLSRGLANPADVARFSALEAEAVRAKGRMSPDQEVSLALRTLGLGPEAGEAEISTAFRQRAARYHPEGETPDIELFKVFSAAKNVATKAAKARQAPPAAAAPKDAYQAAAEATGAPVAAPAPARAAPARPAAPAEPARPGIRQRVAEVIYPEGAAERRVQQVEGPEVPSRRAVDALREKYIDRYEAALARQREAARLAEAEEAAKMLPTAPEAPIRPEVPPEPVQAPERVPEAGARPVAPPSGVPAYRPADIIGARAGRTTQATVGGQTYDIPERWLQGRTAAGATMEEAVREWAEQVQAEAQLQAAKQKRKMPPSDELAHVPRGTDRPVPTGGRPVEEVRAEARGAAATGSTGYVQDSETGTMYRVLDTRDPAMLRVVPAEGTGAARLFRRGAVLDIAAPEAAGRELGTPPRDLRPEVERKARAIGIRSMPVAEIRMDPARFQFKQLGSEGVSQELKGVQKWSPQLAGVVSVWHDPVDGQVYVVNGHHRLELAKRLGAKDLNVQFIEAPDARRARAQGAFINVAEGRGTAVDVAKILRDEGITTAGLSEEGVSLRSDLARKGIALSKLDPAIFDLVARAEVPERWGVAIGETLDDPVLQRETLAAVRNTRLSEAEVREVARQVQVAGSEAVAQETLFGTETERRGLYVQRAQVAAALKRRLAKDRQIFGFVSKEGRAEELARAGRTTIDVEAAQGLAQLSATAEEVFDRLYTRSGPVAEIVSEGARRLSHGEPIQAIAANLYPRVGAAVQAEIGRGLAEVGGERTPVGETGPPAPSGGIGGEGEARAVTSEDPTQAAIFEEGRPYRSLDTMSEAIALSSPSGKMSSQARAAAAERLRVALFGPEGLQRPSPRQPTEAESLLRQARELRDLAARGMKPQAYTKQAEEMERRAGEWLVANRIAEAGAPYIVPGSRAPTTEEMQAALGPPQSPLEGIDFAKEPTENLTRLRDLAQRALGASQVPVERTIYQADIRRLDAEITDRAGKGKALPLKPTGESPEASAKRVARAGTLDDVTAKRMGFSPADQKAINKLLGSLLTGAPPRVDYGALQQRWDALQGQDVRVIGGAHARTYGGRTGRVVTPAEATADIADQGNRQRTAAMLERSLREIAPEFQLVAFGPTEQPFVRVEDLEVVPPMGVREGGRPADEAARQEDLFGPPKLIGREQAELLTDAAGRARGEVGALERKLSPEEVGRVRREGTEPEGARPLELLPATPAEMPQRALDHFGQTDRFDEAGYLTPDGRLVDFSGRHERGAEAGIRSTGHRRVGDAIGRPDNDEAVRAFLDAGNIRIAGFDDSVVGLTASRPLTPSQQSAVRRGIAIVLRTSRYPVPVWFEVTGPDGAVLANGSRDVLSVDDAMQLVDDVEAQAFQGRAPTIPELPPPPAQTEVATATALYQRSVGPAQGRRVFGSPNAAETAVQLALFANRVPTLDDRLQLVRGVPQGRVDIRGKRAASADDIGTVMRPFRSPKAETIHWLLTDDAGMVLAQTMETSGAVDYVAYGKTMPQVYAELVRRAERVGATKLVLIHNHPSGGVRPSPMDVQFTNGIVRYLREGVQTPSGRRMQSPLRLDRHYIIDHDTVAEIRVPAEVYDQAEPPRHVEYEVQTHKVPTAATGVDWTAPGQRTAMTPADIVKLAGFPAHNRGDVVYRDGQGRVLAVAPHHLGAFEHLDRWLDAEAKSIGASQAVVVVDANMPAGYTAVVRHARGFDGQTQILDIIGTEQGGERWINARALGHFPLQPAAGDVEGRVRLAQRVGEEPAAYDPGRPPGPVPVPDTPPRPPQLAAADAAAVTRVAGTIDFTGTQARDLATALRGKGVKAWLRRIYHAVHLTAPIEEVGFAAEAKGLRPTRNPAYLLTYWKSADQVKNEFYRGQPLDPERNPMDGVPNAVQVFEPLGNNPEYVRRGLTYIKALRDLGRGLRGVGGDEALLAAANRTVEALGGDPRIALFADRWRQYVDGLRRYAVGSGLWTEEQATAIVESDLIYAPYRRLLPDLRALSARSGTARGLVNVTAGVQKFHGSQLSVANLAEALFDYTARIIDRAERYRVGASLFDAQEVMGEGFPVLTPLDRSPQLDLLEQVVQAAEAGGLSEDAARGLVDLSDLALALSDKNPVIWRHDPTTGEREYALVNSPDVWRAVQGMRPIEPSALRTFLGWILGGPKRLFTAATTGLNPRFVTATNPIRDIVDALIKSESGMGPTDVLVGYGQALERALLPMKETVARQWERAGLANVAIVDQPLNPRTVQKLLAPVTPWEKISAKLRRWVTAPIAGMEYLGRASDQGPRLAEIRAAVRTKAPMVDEGVWTPADLRLYAATKGRGATLDFFNKPANPVLRAFADYIPFFNPSIQAPFRMGAAAARHPARVGAGFAAVAIAAVIAWIMKHRSKEAYERVTERTPGERAAYLILPLDDNGSWTVRLPINQELALVASGITAALDAWLDEEPEAAQIFIEGMKRALPPGVEELSNGVAPFPVMREIGEIAKNRVTFWERPVTPRGLERLPPEMQRRETTPATFDLLASAVRSLGVEANPLEVEHITRGLLGNFTSVVTQATDPLARLTPAGRRYPTVPFQTRRHPLNPAGAVLASAVPATTKSEQRYYELRSQAFAAEAAIRNGGDRERFGRLASLAATFRALDKRLDPLRDRQQRIIETLRAGELGKDEAYQALDSLRAEEMQNFRKWMVRLDKQFTDATAASYRPSGRRRPRAPSRPQRPMRP